MTIELERKQWEMVIRALEQRSYPEDDLRNITRDIKRQLNNE